MTVKSLSLVWGGLRRSIILRTKLKYQDRLLLTSDLSRHLFPLHIYRAFEWRIARFKYLPKQEEVVLTALIALPASREEVVRT